MKTFLVAGVSRQVGLVLSMGCKPTSLEDASALAGLVGGTGSHTMCGSTTPVIHLGCIANDSVTAQADWLLSTVITPACHEGAGALGSRPEQIQGRKAAGLPSIQVHLAGCQQHLTLVTQNLQVQGYRICDTNSPEKARAWAHAEVARCMVTVAELHDSQTFPGT